MRRRLISLLAIAASIGGSALAAETGDYLYTPVAKFKVTGTNLIANGNFSNLTEGWTNHAIRAYSGFPPIRQCSCRAYQKKRVRRFFRCTLLRMVMELLK